MNKKCISTLNSFIYDYLVCFGQLNVLFFELRFLLYALRMKKLYDLIDLLSGLIQITLVCLNFHFSINIGQKYSQYKI